MHTEPCGHCGDPASLALLRTVQLLVDDNEVDEQTLCPSCFSDWIARYQEEMATDMPGSTEPQTTGGDIRIAEEDESLHSHQIDDGSEERLTDAIGESGDEIHDLSTGRNSDSIDSIDTSDNSDNSDSNHAVEVDLDSEAAVPLDDADTEDDDAGLL